jgi:hypothetical protein
VQKKKANAPQDMTQADSRGFVSEISVIEKPRIKY